MCTVSSTPWVRSQSTLEAPEEASEVFVLLFGMRRGVLRFGGEKRLHAPPRGSFRSSGRLYC